MSGTLNGKVAIVTGASSGIGRAAARLFAKEGARVVVTARRGDELHRLADEIEADGGEAAVLAGDIRDEGLAEATVALARTRFGGLDVAFNNAGDVGPSQALAELDLADWRSVLEVNLTSAFLGAKHQVPAMLERGGGSIIFTSTFVGSGAGIPGMGAYAAAKSGLAGLTQVLAAEYGARGVRANALLAGGTDTPMGRAVASTEEMLAFVESLHALKRRAQPEEIARAALFLASDAASFVTGSSMVVDGGATINRT